MVCQYNDALMQHHIWSLNRGCLYHITHINYMPFDMICDVWLTLRKIALALVGEM